MCSSYLMQGTDCGSARAQVGTAHAVGGIKLHITDEADRELLLRQVRSILDRAKLDELFVELSGHDKFR